MQSVLAQFPGLCALPVQAAKGALSGQDVEGIDFGTLLLAPDVTDSGPEPAPAEVMVEAARDPGFAALWPMGEGLALCPAEKAVLAILPADQMARAAEDTITPAALAFAPPEVVPKSAAVLPDQGALLAATSGKSAPIALPVAPTGSPPSGSAEGAFASTVFPVPPISPNVDSRSKILATSVAATPPPVPEARGKASPGPSPTSEQQVVAQNVARDTEASCAKSGAAGVAYPVAVSAAMPLAAAVGAPAGGLLAGWGGEDLAQRPQPQIVPGSADTALGLASAALSDVVAFSVLPIAASDADVKQAMADDLTLTPAGMEKPSADAPQIMPPVDEAAAPMPGAERAGRQVSAWEAAFPVLPARQPAGATVSTVASGLPSVVLAANPTAGVLQADATGQIDRRADDAAAGAGTSRPVKRATLTAGIALPAATGLATPLVLHDQPTALFELPPDEALASFGAGTGGPAAHPLATGTQPLSASPLVPHMVAQIVAGLSSAKPGVTEIALSPEELGRVTLLLQADAQDPDRMVIMLSFDRPETLDLFRRHADQLAEVIRSAGYSGVDISFAQGGNTEGESASGYTPSPADDAFATRPDLPLPIAAEPLAHRADAGLYLRL